MKMNYRKLASIGLLAAGSLLAQTGPGPQRGMGRAMGRGFGMAAGQSRTPVTGQPYSAVRTEQIQQTLAGGNQIQRQEQENVLPGLKKSSFSEVPQINSPRAPLGVWVTTQEQSRAPRGR